MTKKLEKLLLNHKTLDCVGMADKGFCQIQISEKNFLDVNLRTLFKEVSKLIKFSHLSPKTQKSLFGLKQCLTNKKI